MASIEEQYSNQFYDWEHRGRGYTVWTAPVAPEPPFRPFYGHFLPEAPVIDDGCRPTIFSSLVQQLSKTLSTTRSSAESPEPEEEPEPTLLERDSVAELQVSLPVKFSAKPAEFARVLTQLAFYTAPLSFEIIGTSQSIIIQFAVHPHDLPTLRRQLKAQFPEAVLLEAEDTLATLWNEEDEPNAAVLEFGLEREFHYPLAESFGDPYVGIIGALSELDPAELGLFQILFQPVAHDWAESAVRSVTDATGKPFFVNAPELAARAQEKVSSQLFAAVVRVATKAESFGRAWKIARDLARALRVFSRVGGNSLIPLLNDGYPFPEHCSDVPLRQSRRCGMLVNINELVGFVHLPSADVREPKLVREIAKTKAPPRSAVQLHSGLVLGTNVHAGQVAEVRLTAEQRGQHAHILGVSGSGKSTLLFNMIQQDIENGEGLAVLDPHGDLIERVLGAVPPHREKDVILIDPSEEGYAVGFNVLAAHNELEKTLLASDLVSVFERLSTSWGDQLGSVLSNAIAAFLDSSKGGTLVELRRFLVEPAFRNKFLETVRDPNILYYWQKGFPQLSGNKSIGPVLTRLETFLSKKPICNMVAQRENRLDFANMMDSGKIFLAKLPQGLMGKENAFLLGSLFVARFQETAMSRQAMDAESRRAFWLYIDEFHNFMCPSMAEILSAARKYRLGLILAHQELRQLERNREVASAVMSHPYTRIVFRVGDADAHALESGFSFFEARDLQNLNRGQAIARLERSDQDFNLTISPPEDIDWAQTKETRERVATGSREKYGKSKDEIESELMRQLGLSENRSDRVADSKSQEPQPTITKSEPQPPKESKPSPKPPSVSKPPEIRTDTLTPRDLGRGGAQHQAIQRRIKEAAEKLGFRSSIEREILDGSGSIDLLLERSDISFACEISITTTVDHEVGNVVKCLKAGFSKVAVICIEESKSAKIRDAVIGSLGTGLTSRVECHTPDHFIAHLESISAALKDTASPDKKRGYKVKRSTAVLTPEERKIQEEAAIRSIAETMKK